MAATARTYDITEFISSNTRIRFRLAYLFAGASERVDIDNFEIRATTAAPAALKTGHWEVRVDMSKALTANAAVQNGDETNAFGIRASDGDTTSGGSEFNVYSYVNTSGLDDNDATRSYTDYPLVTSGCDFDAANFDWDADLAANVAADPDINPPFGTFKLTGRETAYTHTLATLSNNNTWYSENITSWTTREDATNYGIWKSEFRIDDPGDGNYVPHYYMDYDAAVITPPASNAPADALRNYFPNDAAGAPAKPYIKQFVRFKDPQPAPSANPPLVGQTARYVVYLQVVNPSGSTGSIVFNATRTVTSRFPGGTLTYRGVAIMTHGAMVSQPTIGSNTAGDIVWNPGTLTAGSGGVDNVAQLSYELDLTPTVAPYTTQFVGVPASGNGTRATWLDETGYDVGGSRSIFSTGELCNLFVTQDVITPGAGLELPRLPPERPDGGRMADRGRSQDHLVRPAAPGRQGPRPGQRGKALGADRLAPGRHLPPARPGRARRPGRLRPGRPRLGRPQHHLRPLPGSMPRIRCPARRSPAPTAWRCTILRPATSPTSRRRRRPRWPGRSAAIPRRWRSKPPNAGSTGSAAPPSPSGFGLSAGQVDAFLTGGKFDLRRAGQAVAWTPAPGNAGLDFYAPGFENAYTGADVFRLTLGTGVQMRKIDGKALPLDWSGGPFRDVSPCRAEPAAGGAAAARSARRLLLLGFRAPRHRRRDPQLRLRPAGAGRRRLAGPAPARPPGRRGRQPPARAEPERHPDRHRHRGGHAPPPAPPSTSAPRCCWPAPTA